MLVYNRLWGARTEAERANRRLSQQYRQEGTVAWNRKKDGRV